MKQYYQFVILTNDQLNDYNIPFSNLIINEKVELIDENHLSFNDLIIEFDYLIFTNPLHINNFFNTNIIHEAGLPIINYDCQTIYENIYFTTNTNILNIIKTICEH